MRHTLKEPEHLLITDSDADYWLDQLYDQEGDTAAYNTAKRLFWALQGFYSHDLITTQQYACQKREVINRVKRKLGELD